MGYSSQNVPALAGVAESDRQERGDPQIFPGVPQAPLSYWGGDQYDVRKEKGSYVSEQNSVPGTSQKSCGQSSLQLYLVGRIVISELQMRKLRLGKVK